MKSRSKTTAMYVHLLSISDLKISKNGEKKARNSFTDDDWDAGGMGRHAFKRRLIRFFYYPAFNPFFPNDLIIAILSTQCNVCPCLPVLVMLVFPPFHKFCYFYQVLGLIFLLITVMEVYQEWCGIAKPTQALFKQIKNSLGDSKLLFAAVFFRLFCKKFG